MSLKKIKIVKIKRIKNNKVDILKYINRKDKFLKKFGEYILQKLNIIKLKDGTCYKLIKFNRKYVH